ncbi:MAG: nitroreductase family protein [Candidatus Aminicenantes bacterium]|nr:MAG: nitroreductase family protein [Candidatus Aminicenantes bacterium]
MDFYEVIRKRQSVRIYKTDPIPGDVLDRILEAFRAAPSWANTQPWELILVTDTKIKEQLQKTLSRNNPASAAVADAPVVVCPIGITGVSGFYQGKPLTGRGDWVLFDLGIASEHLALAAAAEGLGTVHVGAFDYQTAGEILGLPEDRTVIELIPLGYPAYSPRQVPRKPLQDFLFKNKYGEK